jgi:hypothetical protein
MKKITFYFALVLSIGVLSVLTGCANNDAGTTDAPPPVVDKSAKSAGAPPTVAQPGAPAVAPKTSYDGKGMPPDLKAQYQRMGAPIK